MHYTSIIELIEEFQAEDTFDYSSDDENVELINLIDNIPKDIEFSFSPVSQLSTSTPSFGSLRKSARRSWFFLSLFHFLLRFNSNTLPPFFLQLFRSSLLHSSKIFQNACIREARRVFSLRHRHHSFPLRSKSSFPLPSFLLPFPSSFVLSLLSLLFLLFPSLSLLSLLFLFFLFCIFALLQDGLMTKKNYGIVTTRPSKISLNGPHGLTTNQRRLRHIRTISIRNIQPYFSPSSSGLIDCFFTLHPPLPPPPSPFPFPLSCSLPPSLFSSLSHSLPLPPSLFPFPLPSPSPSLFSFPLPFSFLSSPFSAPFASSTFSFLPFSNTLS